MHNPTGRPVTIDPQPTPGLVPLNSASDHVSPGATENHDYVVAEDRLGGTYAWPTASQLATAGGYEVEKTGDTKFLASRFAKPGPLGAMSQPSIEAAAHELAAARTGPGGIIGETSDIDADGLLDARAEAAAGSPSRSPGTAGRSASA